VGDESGFDIRECRQCSLVYVSPQPTLADLPRFYEDMYPDATEESIRARKASRLVERQAAGILRKRLPEGGHVLDMGCGYGGFLETLAPYGYTLSAAELSATAAAHARKLVPEADIRTGSFDDLDYAAESFDAVVMLAVLEHLKDPKGAVAQVAGWLRPGGTIMILVPYVQAFFRLKQRLPFVPIAFEAPRHLFDFSPKTMQRLLSENGFTAPKVRIGLPYFTESIASTAPIWAIKLPGFALYGLTGGRYVYPFAGAILTTATKRGD